MFRFAKEEFELYNIDNIVKCIQVGGCSHSDDDNYKRLNGE